MTDNKDLPVIYSLRNCPFAMRARMAIFYAQLPVILRDVVLSDKPKAMLTASPKGTVPVLVEIKPNYEVIEESLEIMVWAFSKNDPDGYLQQYNSDALPRMLELIAKFDSEFKTRLETYKCAKRYHEENIVEHRKACEVYISDLEMRLSNTAFIMSSSPTIVDIALLPFIRQFSRVERQWYLQSPYPNLRNWLNNYLQSSMFSKVMTKRPLWAELDDSATIHYADINQSRK